jgi:hypothetical protein
MSRSIRSLKNEAVSFSVRESSTYASDQCGVWEGIAAFHRSHGTTSETGAMRDACEQRREGLVAYLASFPCQENQCGMAVLIKGRVAGVEFVSRAGAYSHIHGKLLGSYVMDIPMAPAGSSGPSEKKVVKILDRVMSATEERFPSVGAGEDCRFTAQGLVGSALACGNWYVHSAFFRSDRRSGNRDSSCERMSSMAMRRGYRRS